MKKLPEAKAPKDEEAWLEEISDIKAFNQPEEKPQAPLILKPVEPSLKEKGLYNANSFQFLEVGNVDNLDGKTAERFRKGQYPIEAKLDLHGLKEKEAFEAVKDFILKSYLHKKRCVLIITGKGIKKDDEPWYEAKGVIREALPTWLNNPEIRPFILSMTPAKVEDGGSGAMYVLLKRQRNL